MSTLATETVTAVPHWNDSLFSFKTTRDPGLRFANGQFVSIDNGAGFMTRRPTRPRERLQQATRFSRSLVTEVRRMDPEAVWPILFPDPTPTEEAMFTAFVERRIEFLGYIDELISEHGEHAVLFFE